MKKQNSWDTNLQEVQEDFEALIWDSHRQKWWSQMKLAIDKTKERETYTAILGQIRHFPEYLKTVRHYFLDDTEMESYLNTNKLLINEMPLSVQIQTYQSSLIDMVKRLIWHIKRWQKSEIDEVLTDEVFWGLGEVSLEDQIDLEYKRKMNTNT